MTEKAWLYDRREDKCFVMYASEADRKYHGTDAGARLDRFVVLGATDTASALSAARLWVACWEDQDEECVPDAMGLAEREYRPGKTYMTLQVF